MFNYVETFSPSTVSILWNCKSYCPNYIWHIQTSEFDNFITISLFFSSKSLVNILLLAFCIKEVIHGEEFDKYPKQEKRFDKKDVLQA